MTLYKVTRTTTCKETRFIESENKDKALELLNYEDIDSDNAEFDCDSGEWFIEEEEN